MAFGLFVSFVLATMFLTYGVLLLVSPRAFLRVYDFVTQEHKNPLAPKAWRQRVDTPEFKMLGVASIGFGSLVLFAFFMILFGRIVAH